MNSKQQHDRNEFIAGLRALLDMYSGAPELPAPVVSEVIVLFVHDLKDFLALRRQCGFREKTESEDGEYFRFERRLSERMKLCLLLNKAKTCERIEVGEKVIPAAPAVSLPAREERVEKLYKWVCPPSLLALESEASDG